MQDKGSRRRMTLILMLGVAMISIAYAYFSYVPLSPGFGALDTGGRLAIGAVLILTITLLFIEARKNES